MTMNSVTKIATYRKLFLNFSTTNFRRKLKFEVLFSNNFHNKSSSHHFIRLLNFSNDKITNRDTLANYSIRDESPSERELSVAEYEKISNETLESLFDYFDELIEKATHLEDADVSYADGVLTVRFGETYGTYVLNRQVPNKQIWLSSPKSGPKRYDFSENRWIYKHDGKSLHDLLNLEIQAIVKSPVSFDLCSHSGNKSLKSQSQFHKHLLLLPAIDLIMEIMEDGNLVDRVRILLQRDMKYYQEMQTVLHESMCVKVSGGMLDFPRHASFAAIKIVIWWEAEFSIAFKSPSGLSSSIEQKYDSSDDIEGVIKNMQPSEFILLIIGTSEQLLEHLHKLIQESLDHADLTVLTATLGASALIRNCLWCYSQRARGIVPIDSTIKLKECYKSFREMTEAVGDRLLDLHCRLISLYILNEADSLNWECERPFFEKERSSYVIQMWWLYIQGTRADLWNKVSPRMAQRVLSGMLNESLTILSTRFIHSRPSLERSEQFWSDAFNVLCCTGHLTLNACSNTSEIIRSDDKLSILMKNIHAKCNEILVCLLLRGTPLRILYQVFQNGLKNLTISQSHNGVSPWFFVAVPDLFGCPNEFPYPQHLSRNQATILEINVLKSQPQPNWYQLIKVLLMNDYTVSKILFRSLIQQYTNQQSNVNYAESKNNSSQIEFCGGFLCTGNSCQRNPQINSASALFSLTYILTNIIKDHESVIVAALELDPDWSDHLDKQQVWTQLRPPWLNALLSSLRPMMIMIVRILLDAVKMTFFYTACLSRINYFTKFALITFCPEDPKVYVHVF